MVKAIKGDRAQMINTNYDSEGNEEDDSSFSRSKRIPSIPSMEWVHLQIVPNCVYSETAAKFTGLLEIKRAVQSRTLRKEHMDQHWVHALTRYYLEWSVELKLVYGRVEFFGQDDKAKIPIEDKVSEISELYFNPAR